MIKRLARCIREYKKAAILAPLCMVGEVAMEVMIPLVMANLYDYGIVMQDMGIVVTRAILLVLCAIASLSFGVASQLRFQGGHRLRQEPAPRYVPPCPGFQLQ